MRFVKGDMRITFALIFPEQHWWFNVIIVVLKKDVFCNDLGKLENGVCHSSISYNLGSNTWVQRRSSNLRNQVILET